MPIKTFAIIILENKIYGCEKSFNVILLDNKFDTEICDYI